MRLPVYVIHRDQPKRCLATIEAWRSQTVEVDLVIVDNGSTPENRSVIADAEPGVRVIANGRNLGFGPAVNVAWRDCLDRRSADYVVVCPHDALPEPACAERVMKAMRGRPRAGLACAEFGLDEIPVVDDYFGGMSVPASRGEGWQPVGYPHGTLLAAATACIRDVGFIDERYFAYTEEADYAVRAAERGWEVGMVWGAVVENPHLSTPAAIGEYLMLRNSLLFVRDHFGAYKAWNRVAVASLDTAYRWARPSRRDPWFSARARFRGVTDFARGRFGPPPTDLSRLTTG